MCTTWPPIDICFLLSLGYRFMCSSVFSQGVLVCLACVSDIWRLALGFSLKVLFFFFHPSIAHACFCFMCCFLFSFFKNLLYVFFLSFAIVHISNFVFYASASLIISFPLELRFIAIEIYYVTWTSLKTNWEWKMWLSNNLLIMKTITREHLLHAL